MQLIALGVVAAGGWYLWKTLKREMRKLDREEAEAKAKPQKSLVRDPATGRYRIGDES